ncbi:mandelate racemase/muconate lactonizing enzyme family protein [soil metagenome]
MKITRLRTSVASIPFDPPIDIGTGVLRSSGCVMVFLETDQGVVGEGLVSSLNGQGLPMIDAIVHSMEPHVLGLDPTLSGAFSIKAGAQARAFGHAGISIVALAAIENALWDLRAKLLGVNVSRLIGACRTSVPCYQSDELWIALTIDELQRSAAKQVDKGFRAMKMRLKGTTEDVARVRAVREAIGPDVALMADLNQKLRVPAAIRLGRDLEEFKLAWIEEPVAFHNHAGEAQVAAALDTPIASGESVYTSKGVREMLQLGSVDVLMPDLQRMGGPGEFIKAAHLAEAFDIPVSGHLFPEMSLALMASLPNAAIVEVMPWASPLYKEKIELNDKGEAIVPDRAGWGFSLDPKAIESLKV